MKKKSLSIIIALTLVSALVPAANVFAATLAPESTYGIEYEGQVQNIGWQAPVTTIGDVSNISAAPIAGTVQKGLRVEALKITGTNLPQGASITYQGQVQNKGWMSPVTTTGNADISTVSIAGTVNLGLRVEAFKITLNGLPGYAVKYQTQVQNKGWMDPVQTTNGTDIKTSAMAGTQNQGLRMEALKVQIVKTDSEKAAEVTAIDAVTLALNTKATTDITAAITDVQAVQDGAEKASLTSILNGLGVITGYVNNPELQTDLNVRASASLTGAIQGVLYNYDKVQILGTVVDASNNQWDKISYKGSTAYVFSSYIQIYSSPSDAVVSTAANITKQFEVGNANEIAGNADGQGLSLGNLQWCIGQGTVQPLLNRMDREYPAELENIFGVNYNALHAMTLDTLANQLIWAESINDSSNGIISPWNAEFVTLTNNSDFQSIETDAEVCYVNQAMLICSKYNLKTVRGFALAFDIAVQNGSISSNATKTIDAVTAANPRITEKNLLTVIANAVADSSTDTTDVRARKLAIVNGYGTVHESMLYLDRDFGLSDSLY